MLIFTAGVQLAGSFSISRQHVAKVTDADVDCLAQRPLGVSETGVYPPYQKALLRGKMMINHHICWVHYFQTQPFQKSSIPHESVFFSWLLYSSLRWRYQHGHWGHLFLKENRSWDLKDRTIGAGQRCRHGWPQAAWQKNTDLWRFSLAPIFFTNAWFRLWSMRDFRDFLQDIIFLITTRVFLWFPMVFLWFPMVFLWFSYGFPMVFLWFSYGFPMVFLWFSCGFPMVFLWFSHGFPMVFLWVFLWFSYGFPVVFLWFSYGFPMVFPWFSHGFPMVFLWFSYGFPMVFLWFSHGFPMVFLWFSSGFPLVFLWFSYGFPIVFLWFSYGFPMVFLWFPVHFPMGFLYAPGVGHGSHLAGPSTGRCGAPDVSPSGLGHRSLWETGCPTRWGAVGSPSMRTGWGEPHDFFLRFFFDHLRIFLWESWGEDCFNIVFHKRWERKLPREVVRIGILFYLILAALNNPRDGFLSSEGQHLHFGWWISPFLSIEPWFFWVNQQTTQHFLLLQPQLFATVLKLPIFILQ